MEGGRGARERRRETASSIQGARGTRAGTAGWRPSAHARTMSRGPRTGPHSSKRCSRYPSHPAGPGSRDRAASPRLQPALCGSGPRSGWASGEALAADCGCKVPDCGAAAAGGARVGRGSGADGARIVGVGHEGSRGLWGGTWCATRRACWRYVLEIRVGDTCWRYVLEIRRFKLSHARV